MDFVVIFIIVLWFLLMVVLLSSAGNGDNNLSLEEFWDELSDWSQKTFGDDKTRGPTGPLKHLALEVQEGLASPDDLMEYADMVFLVFDACRRAGYSYEDLEKSVETKLEINKKRKWGPQTTDQATLHVEE